MDLQTAWGLPVAIRSLASRRSKTSLILRWPSAYRFVQDRTAICHLCLLVPPESRFHDL